MSSAQAFRSAVQVPGAPSSNVPDGVADLWAAVMRQAVRDVQGCSYAHRPEMNEAWAFLTDSHGRWAQTRADICWSCGVDPDVVRAEILRTVPHPEITWQRKTVATRRLALAAAQRALAKAEKPFERETLAETIERAQAALDEDLRRLAEIEAARGVPAAERRRVA